MLPTGNIFTTAPRPSDHASRPSRMAAILRRSSAESFCQCSINRESSGGSALQSALQDWESVVFPVETKAVRVPAAPFSFCPCFQGLVAPPLVPAEVGQSGSCCALCGAQRAKTPLLPASMRPLQHRPALERRCPQRSGASSRSTRDSHRNSRRGTW